MENLPTLYILTYQGTDGAVDHSIWLSEGEAHSFAEKQPDKGWQTVPIDARGVLADAIGHEEDVPF